MAAKRIFIKALGCDLPAWALCRLLGRYLEKYPKSDSLSALIGQLKSGLSVTVSTHSWTADAFAALSQDLRMTAEEYEAIVPLVLGDEFWS